MIDNKLKIFHILSWKPEELIAKVLYDNGIKTQEAYREWLKTTNMVIPQSTSVSVENVLRDIEINFTDPNYIPNIFNLK